MSGRNNRGWFWYLLCLTRGDLIKKLCFVFTWGCILLLLAGCDSSFNDETSYETIVSYVNTNYEILQEFPYDQITDFDELHSSYEEYEERDENEKAVINNYLGKHTIVKSVYAYNENILEFYCGGSGMLMHSTYTGFYYSKDDVPSTLSFGDAELTETEPDDYVWEDERHRIHTVKIRDNWYYYMMQWI